jgi:hypothetical protein
MLKHVLHDRNDERTGSILKQCHRAMGSEGTLLNFEGVYPERIDTPTRAWLQRLMM